MKDNTAPTPRFATIRIDGNGPVGLACALWLVRAGIDARHIALPLTQPPSSILPDNGPRRAIALSEGSCQLLARLIHLPPSGRIADIEIFQQGTTGRTRIETRDMSLESLGHVVDWQALIRQLHAAAQRLDFAPADDARFEHPDLLIHAGGLPPPTQRAAHAFSVRDTGQSGLLFEVAVDSTADTAFECFCPEGPLALLPAPPLAGRPRFTVVWCGPTELSQQRAQWSAEALSMALRHTLQSVLGQRHWHRLAPRFGPLRVVTPAFAVPLPRVARQQIVAPGQVWIGNAAQALHPVAGQGLNLGLRDAFELARVVGEHWVGHQRPDIESALATHARNRRCDRQLTIQTTDLFASTFSWPAARRLQSALLTAMHLHAPLRKPLAKALIYGHRQ
ncbi:MAG: FAD-dependent monooxygenase [Lautropia sp.]|nr:FAD-dependent monooxygenase [Lautropia sp.]